ncbi:DUF3626 domain-containing protein [Streptomyces reniochalinae]|uniref:DUF3626 domain-containing protein n=1 Tax=Streptomyces reniochalinae TaxID=2250578 RepID=A0A367F627_9ACTN|nr:DUF3626 domain-containing protein [Streptomyces reniochalinae]RCG25814.1 DUF3626 domain-containing protein [Streptomyces reniochalinae]
METHLRGATGRAGRVALGPPQLRALRYVAARSRGGPLGAEARVTVNFHPDRLVGEEQVLERLAREGTYSSQFVTGVGNGGLTAHPGGDRWRWEARMFGGAYDEAPPEERPVYGALDHRSRRAGAAPRFGSAHLRLTRETLARATFCYPDSVTEPSAFGVASRMALVELAEAESRDLLDDYVEAQVHGGVRLDRDVDALVLDPSFRNTAVEAAAARLPCPVEWHPGFVLTADELRRHPDYRGQEYVDLGVRIAREGGGGRLDPRVLGEAVRTGGHDPQAVKKVWHCLARFGCASTDVHP